MEYRKLDWALSASKFVTIFLLIAEIWNLYDFEASPDSVSKPWRIYFYPILFSLFLTCHFLKLNKFKILLILYIQLLILSMIFIELNNSVSDLASFFSQIKTSYIYQINSMIIMTYLLWAIYFSTILLVSTKKLR